MDHRCRPAEAARALEEGSYEVTSHSWYSAALILLFGAAARSQTADKKYLIVLIGPTGSGKATQAEFLKKRFGIPTIAVGELIQANPAALAKYRRPGLRSASRTTIA